MAIKQRLQTVLLCIPLLLGAFAGVPMRPEEIEELIHSSNQQKLSYVIPAEDEFIDDKR